jgi:hypothetical protein
VTHVSAPAYVLDYGYAEGAEEEMVEVFMSLMEIAAEKDRNDLWIALPVERRLCGMMERFPHTTTLFHVLTPGIETPTSLGSSVYLDPVYV